MTKISNQYSLTNILTADLANSRLGINNVSPTVALDVTGAGKFSGALTVSGAINLSSSAVFPTVGLFNRTSDTTLYMVTAPTGFALLDNSQNTMYGATPTSHIWNINNSEKMRITSAGDVGIGTSSPGYKLQVSGTGYFSGALSSGSNISASGTLSSAALSTSQVLYAVNLTTFNYAGTLALTVPNALNSGSTLAEIRMYMIWATGFGDASHAGARIWLMIMNGNGTAYSAVELLGRDTDGGSGLSISRSAVNQITISSNGYGFIKSVSCMQLITN